MRLPLANNPTVAGIRAAVLAALILAASVLGARAHDASPPPAEYLTGHVFAAHAGPFAIEAEYRADGSLTIGSPLGRFDGRWMAAGEALCLSFDNGPVMGLHCTRIVSHGDGRLVLANGRVLHEIAAFIDISR